MDSADFGSKTSAAKAPGRVKAVNAKIVADKILFFIRINEDMSVSAHRSTDQID